MQSEVMGVRMADRVSGEGKVTMCGKSTYWMAGDPRHRKGCLQAVKKEGEQSKAPCG